MCHRCLLLRMNVFGAIELHLVALDKLEGCGNWQHCCFPIPAMAEHPTVHLRIKIAYSRYIRLGKQISLQHHSRAQKWLLMRLTGCMDHIITDNGAMLVWPLDHSSACCRRLTREVNHHSDCTRLTQQQDRATYIQHRSCNVCPASGDSVYTYIQECTYTLTWAGWCWDKFFWHLTAQRSMCVLKRGAWLVYVHEQRYMPSVSVAARGDRGLCSVKFLLEIVAVCYPKRVLPST